MVSISHPTEISPRGETVVFPPGEMPYVANQKTVPRDTPNGRWQKNPKVCTLESPCYACVMDDTSAFWDIPRRHSGLYDQVFGAHRDFLEAQQQASFAEPGSLPALSAATSTNIKAMPRHMKALWVTAAVICLLCLALAVV